MGAMDRIQLKAPPGRVQAMADAIARDLEAGHAGDDATELAAALAWLRYRLSRWHATHPPATTD